MASVNMCLLNTDNYQFARCHINFYKTKPPEPHISPDKQ